MKTALLTHPAPELFHLTAIAWTRSPTIHIVGSFFPSWLICLVVGVAIAVLLRGFLGPRKLDSEIGPLAIFYPGISLLISCLIWLLIFS